MGTTKQINIKKIELIIFTMILSTLKILMQGYYKLIKNHIRTSMILDISQRKKLVIV